MPGNVRGFFSLALATALLIFGAATADAQVLYGSVVGNVQDPSGSAVPNGTVTLTNKGTGQTYEGKSDDLGRFSIVNVQPGLYDLKVTGTGFRTYTKADINVNANTVARADVQMEIGTMTEQITVHAEATQLQTDKADTHTTITTQEVTNLPLPGYRNYQSLMNLVPGATPTRFQNSPTDTPGRALATNVNGANANNNVTRIDGAASINVWLPHHVGYVMPVEMIDTVNVTTSAGDAEQGMAGGAAITLVTRSGTNDLHGSAFEFHRDQHLNARNFFLPANQPKPVSIWNNYGATLGGPFIRNKLFWFVSFDGTRERVSNTGRYTVPIDAWRTGDFSAFLPVSAGGTCTGTCAVIYDPNTGNANGTGRTPFAGNKIPSTRISPIAQKMQAYYPAPNIPGGAISSNFFGSAVRRIDRDYFDFKGNWNRNDRHAFNGHYGRMWALSGGNAIFGDAGGPAPGTDPALGDTLIQNTSIAHTYTFSPTVLLDGVFGFQRQFQTVKGNDFGKNFGETLGIPGLNGPDPRQSGFPNVDINGFTSFGSPGWTPLERIEENFTTSHNLTWSKGAHELRFGFDGVLLRLSHWQPELGAGPRGYINFAGGATTLNGGAAANQLNGYAAFLLGLPYQYQKSIQYILMTGREWQFGGFVRDRWQLSRKLTLNLGLRYEYYPLMRRAAGKGLERLDAETNTVYLGGRGDVPVDNGMSVSKKLFAPRIGIAYRMTDTTVIRTGYGINYDPLPFSRPLRGFYPLTVNFNFEAPTTFQSYRPLNEGIPPVFGPDLSTGKVQLPAVADMRTPYGGMIHRGYIQSWNFTVERRFPMDLVGSVAYVGTQTTHQLADLDINAAAPPAPGQPGPGQAGRPYFSRFGRATATNLWDGYLSSHYHSLQTTINKQLSHGLLVKGAYTWSKAINMTDDDGWASVNWNHPSVFYRNRATAGYDRTHIFQVGWVYELPFGQGKSWANQGAAKWIVGGWQINGIMSAYTGTPFSITGGSALNAPGNLQTADQVGPLNRIGAVGPGTYYYEPSAFKAVTDPGRFGTTGRNTVRGPGLWNTDLSIIRGFPIRERVKLDFRAEFLNFPNTSHFNNPASTNVTSADFMRILGSYGERNVQLGIRLGF
jgi:hypothetical protein